MSNWVIVAIPAEDDYVWKISSDKVPHMTILSLGEHEVSPQAAKIESYLQFAADLMLHRFHMSVDHRGTLGPKDADVLFFDKDWMSEELVTFRDALLKSNDILDLYNEAPQFPEWTPHLTLGYPESPAAEDNRDYPGIHGVNFDKIAFWVNDFEGPEILLKAHDSLAMSDMGGPTPSVSNAAWSKYKKSDYTLEQWHRACLIHQHTGAPDSKAQCKLPVRTPDGTLNRNGVHAAAAALAGARGGVNATEEEINKAKASIRSLYTQLGDDMPESMMQHSDDPLDIMYVIAMVSDKMPGDIMHHGVKGQKWGVRRDLKKQDTIARLRRVADGTASKSDLTKTALGVGTKGYGGLLGIKRAGVRADKLDAKRIKKADKKFDESLRGVKGFVKVNNAVASKINPRLETLNAKPKYQVNMLDPKNKAVHKAYIEEYRGLLQKSLNEVMDEIGTNASGTQRLHLQVVGEGMDTTYEGFTESLVHAQTSQDAPDALSRFRVELTFDDNGQITDAKIVPDVLQQGVGLTDSGMLYLLKDQPALAHILEENDLELFHFGIKGMKWGVRRARGSDGRVASEDAKVASDLKAKVKSGGLDALTNHELQKLTTRLNLEQNYSRLTAEPSKLDKAAKVSKTTLKLGKSANEAVSFVRSPVGKALIALVAGKGGKVALARLKG